MIVAAARRQWGESFSGFDVYDLVHAKGSALDALIYAHVFWPEFAVVDGMTFLPFVAEDDADHERIRARRSAVSDPTTVEREFNRVEVAALFGRRRGETSVDEDALLGDFLAQIWSAKLKLDYPSKTFVVELNRPTEDEEVSVVLYERR